MEKGYRSLGMVERFLSKYAEDYVKLTEISTIHY